MSNTEKRTILLVTKMEKSIDPLEMIFYSDGAVAFTHGHGEHFCYLYPDIVKQVRRHFNSMTKEVVTANV
jgi:hypothetical protein